MQDQLFLNSYISELTNKLDFRSNVEMDVIEYILLFYST